MVRHFIIAALRNMAANRLQSAIAILGLAVGITAAILMALVVRNQTGFDHFIPGRDRTYLGVSLFPPSFGRPAFYDLRTHRDTASLLKLNLPQVEQATRLMLTDADNGGPIAFQRGDVTGWETMYWADPSVFAVLPLPVYRGDLKAALSRPDGIVLSRTAARKYFGHDDVVGQSILVSKHPMTIRAVIEDIPSNASELQSGIFASGLASFSGLSSTSATQINQGFNVETYLRLRPGASLEQIANRVPDILRPLFVSLHNLGPLPAMPLLRLDRINLSEDLNAGIGERLAIAKFTGFLILFVAAINFVNLLTARAAQRAAEVGMRKVCGASRFMLIVQFLGETFLVVLLASCVAMAFSEILLPYVNALLGTGATLDYGREPVLLAWLGFGIVLLSLLAGCYPALVLSGFRPANIFKGGITKSTMGGLVRSGLTMPQFAILIGMIIAAVVVYRQRLYATRDALRIPTDQMLLVRVPQGEACSPTFKTEVRKLAGVRGAFCTGGEFLGSERMPSMVLPGDGPSVDAVEVDWGIFGLYGLKPIAGSLASFSPTGDSDPGKITSHVINQSAVKRLGFASPQDAIGKLAGGRHPRFPIVAVIPDFTLYSVEKPQPPAFYSAMLKGPGVGHGVLIQVKLSGRQIPETLAAIDRIWRTTWPDKPVDRIFLDQHMQDQYRGLEREAEIFAIFSGAGIFLACLGLFAVALSTAQRRTKEIGVRKAMGAGDGDVLKLLLWQFAQPVLWANLVAWPVAWWAMTRWLSGFAYHVALNWWLFPAAGAATLLIALLTVAGQAMLVARQKPVLALRYE